MPKMFPALTFWVCSKNREGLQLSFVNFSVCIMSIIGKDIHAVIKFNKYYINIKKVGKKFNLRKLFTKN